MSSDVLRTLREMKIIAHGEVYVINRLSDSELTVWANGFDEAEDIFRTFNKGKCVDVESIEKIETDVIRFAI